MSPSPISRVGMLGGSAAATVYRCVCQNVPMPVLQTDPPPRDSSPPRLYAALGLFGFASGLPLALTGSTLQAWLTQSGVSVEAIGALSLVGLPYLLKFLWAPVVDRYPLTAWSRRRG